MLNRIQMTRKIILRGGAMVSLILMLSACTPELQVREVSHEVPNQYGAAIDSANASKMDWRVYFEDPNLIALIDTALVNNQELNMTLQEIEISRNEVMARRGEYLPSVDVDASAGLDKVGRYTRNGALEANNELKSGKAFPEPLGDWMVGAYASWEVDVWKKLRNAKASAYRRYLSSVDGKNFVVTNLIAEIANSYYELLAMDIQLAIVRQNIDIQEDALEVVKYQKQSARVTELAVKRFEAQLLNTRSLQYEIQQQIFETENRINFLLGRYPQPILRSTTTFDAFAGTSVAAGLPSELLQNRPDIRQAELELMAAKLDVKSAKASFYPSLAIHAGIGLQAFNAAYLVKTPESLLYSLAGDVVGPLINRKAIKAAYFNANAKQVQAVIHYERTVLNAYLEVQNQLANLNNLSNSYDLIAQQVQALTASVEISNTLFKSARADYMEVLLTQREALESRFDLVETKRKQMQAYVHIYRALGGGWDAQ